jgi:hypothetical protein
VAPNQFSLSHWAEQTPVILDGRPFVFDKHEYLREIYNDEHPHIVLEKAAQLGCTTWAILRALYNARWKNYKGILYLFPSRTDTLDFSKSRIAPLITENPESIGDWIRDTDAAGIKQICNTFLYLRGMQSRVGLKSIPVDLVVFDELDEAPQRSVDLAMERMGHSEYKEVIKLSNPTIPDYGINREIQLTDQKYWLLKCLACGEWVCLEETVNLKQMTIGCFIEKSTGVYLGCPKCKSPLNPDQGEWVAKKPGVIERRGYHLTQLFSQYVDPGKLLEKLRTTQHIQEFCNLNLGIAHVEAENRLTVEEVLDRCGGEGIVDSDKGPCSMGVDQGKDLHVLVGKNRIDGRGQIIHMGIYKDWSDLDRLMKNFNVACCVVDALPETRNARAFAERHKGRVYMSYYQTRKRGAYSWDEEEMLVACNRTESLDASHMEIMMRRVILPKRCDIVNEFARHLHNVAKKLEEEEATGSKRYVYVKLGPDHFRHAFNYEVMARPSATPMTVQYESVVTKRLAGQTGAY